MDHRDRLLDLVMRKGPLLPGDINRELDTNVLFASAMLSELVDSGKLRLTKMKIGSSPLYYTPGHEFKLQNFSQHLAQKPKRTYELLKQSQILRDIEQEPLTRACLRELRDFAIPLEVTLNNNTELFWKWYLLSDKDATSMISSHLNIPAEPILQPQNSEPPINSHSTEYQSTEQQPVEQQTLIDTASAPAVEAADITLSAPASESYNPTDQPSTADVFSDSPDQSEPIYSTTITADIKEYPRGVVSKSRKTPASTPPKQSESQQKILEFPKDDLFFNELKSFFKKKSIKIIDFNSIRKSSELDFIISLPSNVGNLTYFCKAKSKKKINDGDLSSAFIQGNIKKLPVLFITKGDLTKKARSLLSTEFKSMCIKQI